MQEFEDRLQEAERAHRDALAANRLLSTQIRLAMADRDRLARLLATVLDQARRAPGGQARVADVLISVAGFRSSDRHKR